VTYGGARLKGIKQTERLDDFLLKLLMRLSVILLVHFARLEITLQLTYGRAQCVLLP
jgi:hypothetical protein